MYLVQAEHSIDLFLQLIISKSSESCQALFLQTVFFYDALIKCVYLRSTLLLTNESWAAATTKHHLPNLSVPVSISVQNNNKEQCQPHLLRMLIFTVYSKRIKKRQK